MIRLDVAAFAGFCEHLTLPSKDFGLVPFRFWNTQRVLIEAIAAGLERDVHSFVVLKGGRQIGGTTTMDALTLWWHQAVEGTQGMLVADDDDNCDYRRDLMLEMNASLPVAYRRQIAVSNRGICRWSNSSRLSFRAAGLRSKNKLGRSRGINFLHADEVGAWTNLRAASSVRASLATHSPQRLDVWNSTAQGINTPFHEMWRTALKVPSQVAVFLAWWMHELRRLVKPTRSSSRLERDLWGLYAVPDRTADERAWIAEVKRRYRHAITDAQLAWYRMTLEAEMHGDEAMMAQEYASLPEEAFQAFGEKVISTGMIRRLRTEQKPEAEGYRYEWGGTLDPSPTGTSLVECAVDDAPLRVWEQPDPSAAYVVSGHPSWSSSPNAAEFIAQVWRAYPDKLIQVAAYSGDSAMYQFAWVLLHLCGAYRTAIPAYFIMEIGGPGFRVLEEIQLVSYYGYGLGIPVKQQLQNVMGSIQHYYYRRPDVLSSRGTTIEWRTQPSNRPWLIHGIRDSLERGALVIRDELLIDELAALRRGEEGDNDQLEAGGRQSDARVICAAMAVECWHHSAMPDLTRYVAPKEQPRGEPRNVLDRTVKAWTEGLVAVSAK